jgi:hypothetical protein
LKGLAADSRLSRGSDGRVPGPDVQRDEPAADRRIALGKLDRLVGVDRVDDQRDQPVGGRALVGADDRAVINSRESCATTGARSVRMVLRSGHVGAD